MMRVAGFAAVLFLGGCALSSAAPTPPAPDPAQEEILSASLLTLRARLSGELVIDPRIAAYDVRPGRSWIGSWTHAQVQAFAALLDAEVAEIEHVVECAFPWRGQSGDAQRCVMKGVDVHLALSRPVIRGDQAAVIAYATADYRTASLRENTRVIRLELALREGEWAVRYSRVIATM